MAKILDADGNVVSNTANTGVSSLDVMSEEQQQEKFRELLNRPEIKQKIDIMANSLEKVLTASADVFKALGIGAQFRDKKSNTIFVYQAFATPYKPDLVTQLILKTANRPFETMPSMGYAVLTCIVFSKQGNKVMEQTQVMAFGDVVKMIATERWEIINMGAQNPTHEDLENISLTD